MEDFGNLRPARGLTPQLLLEVNHMAFPDPTVFTVNSIAKSMARISSTGTSSTYQTADGLFRLEISHQSSRKDGKNRVRSLVRFTQKAVVTNPLDSTNDYDTLPIQVVFDHPEFGFTDVQMGQNAAALFAFLSSGNITKIFGQES
jgi:hypothetical protein